MTGEISNGISKSNKRYVVFGCSLCMQFLVNGMLSAMLGIVYVDIMEEFDSSASQVALMLSLYRGITFGGSIFGNQLIRWIGELPCMMVGSSIGCLSFIAAAFIQDLTSIVFLIGIGAGFGFMFPMLLSYNNIGRAFRGEASKFLTLNAVGAGFGLIVTPYITELILQEYWWRGCFLLSGGLFLHLLVIGIVAEINLPETQEFKASKSFKLKDQLLIFRNRTYCIFVFNVVLFGMFGFVEPWFLPDFLHSKKYDEDRVALLLTVIGIFSLVGRILAGVLEPLLSRNKIAYHWIYVFALMGLSHVMFPYFHNSFPWLIVASILYGTTFGMVVSQSPSIIFQTLSLELYPTGLATQLTIYGIFTVLGGYVGGLLRDVTDDYEIVFYAASLSATIVSLNYCLLFILDKIFKTEANTDSPMISISVISS